MSSTPGQPKVEQPSASGSCPPNVYSITLKPEKKVTVPLPITSRGIGFAVARVFEELSKIPGVDFQDGDLYGALRVSYAAFDYALMQSRLNKHPDSFFHNFDDRLVQFGKSIERLPSPVANIVNAIGKFEHNGVSYSPVLVHKWHPFVPRAECVTYTRLTTYIEELHSLDERVDSIKVGKSFYSFNPLPGANFLQNERCSISNIYDFCGPNMGSDQFPRYDHHEKTPEYIKRFSFLMSHLEDIYPKMAPKAVNFDGKGDASQLVSCTMAQLRCLDLKRGENEVAYIKRLGEEGAVIGDHNRFYSTQSLTDAQYLLGATNLLGEVPEENSLYVTRNYMARTYEREVSYNFANAVLY